MRFVALFRGINVGKAKRIAMADLRALLVQLGFKDVATLLNSGNAVFSAPSEPAREIAARIRKAVAKQLGVDAFVIVKSDKDIAAAISGNELGKVADDPSRLLIVFTSDAKSLASVKSLARADWGAEQVRVGKHAAYLWCANGILESKAASALFKGLVVETSTTRNWATLNKIHALMQGTPATNGR